MNVRIHTIDELHKQAETFLSSLSLCTGATVVVLHGDLGAGKTAFVKGVARALGISERVTSPTFVIEKMYTIPNGSNKQFITLIHIDAYRLESAKELAVLRFDALLRDPGNLIFVEWGERVMESIPEDAHHIYFTFVDENTRDIVYDQ